MLTGGGSECERCTPSISLQGVDIDLVIGAWLQSCSDEQHSEILHPKAPKPSSATSEGPISPHRTVITAHL